MKKRIFAVLFIAVLASMMGLSIIEPLMAIYSMSLGASGLLIGLIFAAFTIGRGIFTPIVGKLSDKNGRKKFIMWGLAAYTLASLGYLFANTTEILIIVRLVQGISSAFIVPVAFAYIGDIAPKGKEGEYLGTFTIAMFLGLAMGPILGGSLTHWFSINIAFAATAVLGFAALVLVITLLPEMGIHSKIKPATFADILRDRTMQEILLLRMVTGFGVTAFIVFLPLYAANLGMNTFQIGVMITLNLLATALPQRHTGKLADSHSKVILMVLGGIIVAITTGMIPFTESYGRLLIVNVIMGFGGAISIPANSAMAAEIGRKHGMGSVMGLLNTSFALGMVAGPLIAGLILDISNLTFVFMYTAVIVGVGSIGFYFLTRRIR